MRYLSLFSGIEAATVSFAPLGWEPVAFAEIDPFCCALLRHYYPGVPNLGDVTTITKAHLDALQPIDLVVFGFPCQDLSVAGLRRGLEHDGKGTRSGLFFDAARIIRESGTCWFLGENVPGLFSSNDGRDFAAVLRELTGLAMVTPNGRWQSAGVAVPGDAGWFSVAWRCLDAQYFNLAQRRERVFFVGYSGEWTGPASVLFERESLGGHPPPSRASGQGAAAAVVKGAAIGRESGNGPQWGEVRDDGTVFTLNATEVHAVVSQALTTRTERFDPTVETLIAFDPTQITSQENRANPQPGDPSFTLGAGPYAPHIAFTAKDFGQDAGGLAPSLRAMEHDGSHANGGGKVAVAYSLHSDALGRSGENDTLTPDADGHWRIRPPGMGVAEDVSYGFNATAPHAVAFEPRAYTRDRTGGASGETVALTASAKYGDGTPHVAAGVMIRRLTPRECERLMGLPDIADSVIIQVCGEKQKSDALAEIRSPKSLKSASTVGGSDLQEPVLSAGESSNISRPESEWPVVLSVSVELEREVAQIRSQGRLLSSVSIAGWREWYLHPETTEGFVPRVVHTFSIRDRIIQGGKAALQPGSRSSLLLPNGSIVVRLFGHEIEQPAAGVEKSTREERNSTKSTTSEVGSSSPNYEQVLITSCCSVMRAISSFIPDAIPTDNSFVVELTRVGGYTLVPYRGKLAADGPRYRAIGNSWAVPTVRWIGRRIALCDEVLRAQAQVDR